VAGFPVGASNQPLERTAHSAGFLEIRGVVACGPPLTGGVRRLVWQWLTINDMRFDYSLDFSTIDFRKHPELYRIGKGEQGVLLVEPYKSEILPHWRFKTPQIARQSANKIYKLFLGYKRQEDFVGMDMARKFLQMGYTRSRRYANHKSGRKYKEGGKEVLPHEEDLAKAESAKIFYEKWQKAKADKKYQALKARHKEAFEEGGRSRRSEQRGA
jgi:hypothetical protein